MIRNSSAADRKNSLLQLTNRNQRSDQEAIDTGADSAALDDQQNEAQSVITQVTSRQPQTGHSSAPPPEARPSWRSRFRALFCCLAPAVNDHYYRDDADASHARPIQPPTPPPLLGEAVLGPIAEEDKGKITLVLDLDETLVHSSFRPVPNPDFVIPVEIEGKVVDVYVLKRPHMDQFMAAVGARFEVVVFTASLSKYADPLLDLLDSGGVVRWRLFRESCCPYEGNYVKNLLCLGRDLSHVIIVDNSPHSYIFQPENALPIGTFIDDPEDVELLEMLPVLTSLERSPDVRQHLGRHVAALQGQQQRARM
ncbi:hypothetical protein WJX73_010623 [Symbiochloris irregularis]|uniref:FCP1 homology domain-containing protein n=1 Tax=Symbiochloris irregularis TaxID=706552 RepID=A0AAW1PM67_9CHLO